MTPWLLVAGDVMPVGGMDGANLALASYLAADADVELHLVAHRASGELLRAGRVQVHTAWRPLGSHMFGAPVMARLGGYWARRLRRRGGRVVVNGGNCPLGDVSWVHYVHAAYVPTTAGGALLSLKDALQHRHGQSSERRTLANVRLVVCNSERTRRDVVERARVPEARTRVVYYGVDPDRFRPISATERAQARAHLGLDPGRPVAVFIGALGDRRKGFDVLFDVWARLADTAAWDVDLLVVGTGRELPAWRARAARRLAGRVTFLGTRTDVDRVLAAADVLVHPARYEAYGLGVHEALCRGLPAVVSAHAGVAERYPRNLADLLVENPESSDEVTERLKFWRAHMRTLRDRVAPFAASLRERSWADMAHELVRTIDQVA